MRPASESPCAPASSARGSLQLRTFGPLQLTLAFDVSGRLVSVRLPPDPPANLRRQHLLEAGQALSLLPLQKAPSPGLENFRIALQAIPLGQTRTYGQLALLLGTSPRAIGSRCAANPLLLRVPCHRVSAHGGPGGFQLGPVWKQILLEAERARA